MNNSKIKQFVLCGLGMAIVFILTCFISVPIGQFGYVNLGDSAVMLFSIVLNPTLSLLCGGIGSALADIYLGYTHYAIFTFFAKGIEGYIVSVLFTKWKDKMNFVIGGLLMVFTYYLADALLYKDWIVATGGVTFNLIQALISTIIATVLKPLFVNINKKFFLD